MTPTFHLIGWGACNLGGPRLLGLVALVVVLVALSPRLGSAEVVMGRVELVRARPIDEVRRGYILTRVTDPAEPPNPQPVPVAVFLRAQETLPLDPAPPSVLALSRLSLSPTAAACAVDGSVMLKNEDLEPATFVVAGKRLGPVPPGSSLSYECVAGARGEELRRVEVVEWPRARAVIYVGEVGAPGVVQPDGTFKIVASKGTYLLRVVGLRGVLVERPVEVSDRSIDAGTIEIGPNEP